MSLRWLCIAGVAVILAVPGCSSSKAPAPSDTASASKSATESSASAAAGSDSSDEPSSEAADPPSAPLDSSSCVDVTGASLDLSAAMSPEDARTAADTLEKFDPPASAKTAIEHFVTTGGAQFDDPDYDKSNTALDNWVHQVCPPS